MNKTIRTLVIFFSAVFLLEVGVVLGSFTLTTKRRCGRVSALLEQPVEVVISTMQQNKRETPVTYTLLVRPTSPPDFLPADAVYMSVTAEEVYRDWMRPGDTILTCLTLLDNISGTVSYTVSDCQIYAGYQSVSYDQQQFRLQYYYDGG